jgi:hypothetical protein
MSSIEEEIKEVERAKEVIWALFVQQYTDRSKFKWPRHGEISESISDETKNILDRIGAREARAEAERPGVA